MEEVVESFVDLLHAEIFAGLLRNHDVAARVENSHLLAANGLWGQALGNFKVLVAKADLLNARGLLSRWRDGEFALDAEMGEPNGHP